MENVNRCCFHGYTVGFECSLLWGSDHLVFPVGVNEMCHWDISPYEVVASFKCLWQGV